MPRMSGQLKCLRAMSTTRGVTILAMGLRYHSVESSSRMYTPDVTGTPVSSMNVGLGFMPPSTWISSCSAVWRSAMTVSGPMAGAPFTIESTLGTQLKAPTTQRPCMSRCWQDAKPLSAAQGDGRAVMMTTRSASSTLVGGRLKREVTDSERSMGTCTGFTLKALRKYSVANASRVFMISSLTTPSGSLTTPSGPTMSSTEHPSQTCMQSADVGTSHATEIAPPTCVHCSAFEPTRAPVKSALSITSQSTLMRMPAVRPAASASSSGRNVTPSLFFVA
mmetsp:Transcript_24599/g.85548  ORF Transcript_24599/g.85548 Transcript_24599/m.85548 type:complete len:278 (+) Transcript_24599:2665-3498(+)